MLINFKSSDETSSPKEAINSSLILWKLSNLSCLFAFGESANLYVLSYVSA